jgi:hypothetical protein
LRPLRLRLPPIWTLIWGVELFSVIDVDSAPADAKLSPGKRMTLETSIKANINTFFFMKNTPLLENLRTFSIRMLKMYQSPCLIELKRGGNCKVL